METKTSTSIGSKEFPWGSKTFILGILNLTPDSFSGDGLADNLKLAIAQGLRFQEEGADFLDVGGESTRPPGLIYGSGAQQIPESEEARRVLSVIRELKSVVNIPISIDTYKAGIAEKAIEAGASMINDVWGLQRDPDLARVAAETGVPIVLTHNNTTTNYQDLLGDIFNSLDKSIEAAIKCGVSEEKIIVDPGIGFGKTPADNLDILRHLEKFKVQYRKPLLVGTSRKSTIGIVLGGLGVNDRLEGTMATIALAIAKGVDIVRVHDVKAASRVVKMSDAIIRGWNPI